MRAGCNMASLVEALTTQLAQQHLDEQPQPGSKLLYVDGLNYASENFFVSRSHWDVALAERNIARFVDAARRSGWTLKVFIVGVT